MEQDSSKLMTPFDCQTTPQWIHILKLMLPYTPRKYQHLLAVFIRFQEMQFTMNYFKGFSEKRQSNNIIQTIKPYMDPASQEIMEQMESMMSMMEMVQMMQGTSDNPFDFNPMDILSGLSGSDLSDIFNMKGSSEHE